jgi:peroxiredoxin
LKRHLQFNKPNRLTLTAALVIAYFFCLPSVSQSQTHQHEWTTIEEVRISGQDDAFRSTIHSLKYPVLGKNDTLSVHEFVQAEKLTLLWYFAAWCWNCNQEISNLNKMHQQFNEQGFQILGIGLYSPLEDLETFRRENDVNFPIVVGPSQVKELDTRDLTAHYELRQMVGDQRTWGTPFNIFIRNDDQVTIYAAPGEIREPALRKFIRSRLR